MSALFRPPSPKPPKYPQHGRQEYGFCLRLRFIAPLFCDIYILFRRTEAGAERGENKTGALSLGRGALSWPCLGGSRGAPFGGRSERFFGGSFLKGRSFSGAKTPGSPFWGSVIRSVTQDKKAPSPRAPLAPKKCIPSKNMLGTTKKYGVQAVKHTHPQKSPYWTHLKHKFRLGPILARPCPASRPVPLLKLG